MLGETEVLGEILGETLLEGLTEAEGDMLGLTLADGLIEIL